MLCHSCYVTVVIGSVAIVHLASSHLPRATKLIISHEIWTKYKSSILKSIQTRAETNHAQAVSIQSPASYTTQKDLILTKTLKDRIPFRFLNERLLLLRMYQFSIYFHDLCLIKMYCSSGKTSKKTLLSSSSSSLAKVNIGYLCVGLLPKYIEKLWMDFIRIFSNCW